MEISVQSDPFTLVIFNGVAEVAKLENETSSITARKLNFEDKASFKDYRPHKFKQLRELYQVQNNCIHMDECRLFIENPPISLNQSLSSKSVLSLGQLKHSGSKFYFTTDKRFIMKTVAKSQFKFLLRILDKYHEHMRQPSLILHIHGLFRVQTSSHSKKYFVVMENSLSVLEGLEKNNIYDIKPHGLLHSRDNGDLHRFIKLDNPLTKLSAVIRSEVAAILKRDVQFLNLVHVNDYSILLGISTDKTAIAVIDVLSEFHLTRKIGFVIFGVLDVYFPRFMRPRVYAKKMEGTVDLLLLGK